MKHIFKKCSLTAITMLIIALCFISCSDNNSGKNKSSDNQAVFVDKFASDNEALYNVVESYSSGILSEDEPLKIKFLSGLKLKKQYGEVLPVDVFEISPKIEGHPVWIDKNTVGFQFDAKPQKQQPYQVKFNLAAFIDMPENKSVMNFGFVLKKQDFVVTDATYFCSDMNTCSYNIDITFANVIDAYRVTALLDKNTIENYKYKATALSDKEIALTISNIPRKKNDYQVEVILDGAAIGVDKTVKQKLTIPADSDFKVMSHQLNKNNKYIIYCFSNPLDKDWNYNGYIEFSEEIKYSTSIDNNRLVVYCNDDYNINNDFDVILREGVASLNGKRLEKDYVISDANLSNIVPKLRWCEDGVIIPDAGTTIYFDAICLDAVMLKIVKIFDNSIMNFLQDNEMTSCYNIRRVGRIEKKVRLNLNSTDYLSWNRHAIKLSDYIDVKPGEFYQLVLDFDMSCYPFACDQETVKKTYNEDYWNNEGYDYQVYYYGGDYRDYNNPCRLNYYNYVNINKNIYVTDLALTVKSCDDDCLDVFVKKITDGTAVSNVDVQLFDFQMQNVGKASTDNNGYVRVKYSNKPYFVVAQDAQGNKSIIKIEKNKSLSMSKFNVSGEAVENGINGFVYSNRDVWRPGDSIQLNLMLSDKDNNIFDNYPVIMELYNPDGRLYLKKANNTPVGKIYSYTIKTQTSDRTGTWHANFKVGNQIFSKKLRLETVKPNRLKIDFDLPEILSVMQNETAQLSSCRLNGMKVKGLKADVTAFLSVGVTSFKDYPQYVFENVSNNFGNSELNLFSSQLGDQGTKLITFGALKNINAPGFLNVNYIIKVFEPDGEFSITSKYGKISPFSRYVGMSLPDTKSRWGKYYFTNEDWNFDVIVVNENGSLPSQKVELNYQIYKLDSYWWWDNDNKYDLMRYAQGTYKRPVLSGTLICQHGKSDLKLNFSDKEWGAYLVVIQDPASGNVFSKILHFDWSDGPSRSSSTGDAPALITLKSDKEKYNVGDNVKLTFPANKNAKAIVTVESASRVLEVLHLDNLSDNASVNIPVTAEMVPNVYVYVSFIQPYNTSNGLPVRMYGVLPIIVNDKNAILNPVVTVPSETNSNKIIDIKVSENKGLAMYYTVAVVDEGILGLTSYKTPDPLTHFFKKQALGIRTWDNYDDIIDVFTDAMNGNLAVGGDGEIIPPETTMFQRFAAIATMMGPFELKAGATNTHQFQVPDYNGSLRVMVVASNGKDAFGKAQKNVTVKDQIMITPTAPRIVAPDDEIAIPVRILAPELKSQEVTLSLKTTNLNLMSNNSQTLIVDGNGEATTTLRFKVPAAKGNASITMTAQSGSYTAKKTVEMPIRLPMSEKHSMVKKELAPHSSEIINVDIQGVEGTLTGKVVFNTGIPVDLFKRLDYLTNYPYSCLEQKVSSSFPKLYLNDLASLDDKTKEEMKYDIELTIDELKSYLRSDYSMTNWKSGNYVTPWTELYALHFLIEAKNQGYEVPQNMLDGMFQYQTNRAKAWNYSVDDPSGETIQAYRLFILALNKTPETAVLNRFKDLETKYTLTKALAAASYALIGKTQIAENMLPVLDYSQKGWLSDYFTSYGSNTRDRAFCTYAEMLINNNIELVQNDIIELCETLNSDEWLDTQTTAFTLFVLGKYSGMTGVKNAPMSLAIKANDIDKTLNTNKSSLTMDLNVKKGNNQIIVENKGDEKVFVTVYTKGIVAEYETEEHGNWYTMSVLYYDKDGNEINPSKLAKNTDFSVEIKVGNPHEYKVTENALSYYVPTGWELINDRLFGDASVNESQCNYIDFRDDRVYFFFDLAPNQTKTFRLKMNAAYEGKFVVPAVHCEDMYNNEIFYVVPSRKVRVEE